MTDYNGALLTIADALTRPAWQRQAACRGTAELGPPDHLSSSRRARNRAKATCFEQCVVRAACLSFALEHPELVGVWGGYTERELVTLRGTEPGASARKTDAA